MINHDSFSSHNYENIEAKNKQIDPSSQKSLPIKAQKSLAAAFSQLTELHKNTSEETSKMLKNVQQTQAARRLNPDHKVADDFVCSSDVYEAKLTLVQENLNESQQFSFPAFLANPKSGSGAQVVNDAILQKSVNFVQTQVKQMAQEQGIPTEKAYKQFIGILDRFDDQANAFHALDRSFQPPSTFALRSALLLASQNDGVPMESWMVYTRSGKPVSQDLWPFLDNWKNWVPEAQGAMAKFAETTLVKVKEMASNGTDSKVMLLKGGFGAGKTRLANLLMGEKSAGVVVPDTGKRVVRRSMESVLHSSAHVQGSQLAYKLFDELIEKQQGTIVYDSSLKFASDVKSYLQKSQNVGKKMVIYDVARNDMARTLSVLKRDVEGDDPRIPPGFIIHSAIQDKLNRVECMYIVLNDASKNAAIQAEYHFMGGNQEGWDTQEVMVLGSNNAIEFKHEEAKKLLFLEGIELDDNGQLHSLVNREKLTDYFEKQFELPVRIVMQQLSSTERQTLMSTFENRVIPLETNAIHDAKDFYAALPARINDVLSDKAVVEAFSSLKPETREAFFMNLQGKKSLSYMDLPLRAALTIHQNLKRDPWRKGM